jgi:hypothetical protein
MSEPTRSEPTRSEPTRIISTVLSPAVKLWLRTQLDQVEDLQVQIVAGDRQLLSGQIASVAVSASRAVYQGLHFSQVSLRGDTIRTNLGQVLRGKPLRLLDAFPVNGDVQLLEADLNASLQAPLLAKAVTDFLVMLLGAEADSFPDIQLRDPQIQFHGETLTISATLLSASGATNPVAVRTGLAVAQGRQLQLVDPQWLPHPRAKKGMAIAELQGYTLDLGSDTHIQALTIGDQSLTIQGQITVQP